MAKAKKNYWEDDGKGHRGKCEGKKSCPALRIAMSGEAALGLMVAVLLNFKTGKSTNAIVYKKAPIDGGCVIAFCPFCGVKQRADHG